MLNFYFDLICLFNCIFWLSIIGIINNKNNVLLMLISLEISYLMIILLFTLTSSQLWGEIENQSYCLLLLILAASESATGLAVLINNYNYTLKTTFSNSQILHV